MEQGDFWNASEQFERVVHLTHHLMMRAVNKDEMAEALQLIEQASATLTNIKQHVEAI